MNLKLRRLVRTPHSEQFALFDLDRTDSDYDPLSIGKVDLHYTGDAVYGTFLLWEGILTGLPEDQIDALVKATIEEICEPMGMPAFFAVEFFSPDVGSYRLHSSEAKNGADGATPTRS